MSATDLKFGLRFSPGNVCFNMILTCCFLKAVSIVSLSQTCEGLDLVLWMGVLLPLEKQGIWLMPHTLLLRRITTLFHRLKEKANQHTKLMWIFCIFLGPACQDV